MISIYDYLDYRAYLKEWFTYQKQSTYGFSHRYFARVADLGSSTYMVRVIAKQRHISEKNISNISNAIGLNRNEEEYFQLLFKIEKTRDDQLREEFAHKLVTIRSKYGSKTLKQPMLEYLSRWYYPVVREIAVLLNSCNSQEIFEHISPPVPLKEINHAISYLVDNGFLIKDQENNIFFKDPIVTTGDEVISDIVNKYHRENLLLSAENLTIFPLVERDISSLTISVSEKMFGVVKTEIQQFRKKILSLTEKCDDNERVYHVGFQLEPRSLKQIENEE